MPVAPGLLRAVRLARAALDTLGRRRPRGEEPPEKRFLRFGAALLGEIRSMGESRVPGPVATSL